jgi:hypothetical protein
MLSKISVEIFEILRPKLARRVASDSFPHPPIQLKPSHSAVRRRTKAAVTLR